MTFPFGLLWILLLTTGLRLGEALGLEWKDVDLDRARIAIRQGLVEVNGYAKIGLLKTKSSRRQVELGATAVKALKRRRATTREEQLVSSFVFTTRTGGIPGERIFGSATFSRSSSQRKSTARRSMLSGIR
jgi:integrase